MIEGCYDQWKRLLLLWNCGLGFWLWLRRSFVLWDFFWLGLCLVWLDGLDVVWGLGWGGLVCSWLLVVILGLFLWAFIVVWSLIVLGLKIAVLKVLGLSLSWIGILQNSGGCIIDKRQEWFFSFFDNPNQKAGRINDTNIASIVHGFSIDNLLNDLIAFDQVDPFANLLSLFQSFKNLDFLNMLN